MWKQKMPTRRRLSPDAVVASLGRVSPAKPVLVVSETIDVRIDRQLSAATTPEHKENKGEESWARGDCTAGKASTESSLSRGSRRLKPLTPWSRQWLGRTRAEVPEPTGINSSSAGLLDNCPGHMVSAGVRRACASKWKRGRKAPTEEELEALLEEDHDAAVAFEALVDTWIRSKDASEMNLEYAMKLPSFLPLFIANAAAPHGIVTANKMWTDMTKQKEAIGKTLAILQGIDSDKNALEGLFGQVEEVCARLWHYTGDGNPFINQISVFPLFDHGTGQISHYLGVMRIQRISEDATKDQLSRLRRLLSSVLGVVSEERELRERKIYSGQMPPARQAGQGSTTRARDPSFYEGIQERLGRPKDVSKYLTKCSMHRAKIEEIEKLSRQLSQDLPPKLDPELRLCADTEVFSRTSSSGSNNMSKSRLNSGDRAHPAHVTDSKAKARRIPDAEWGEAPMQMDTFEMKVARSGSSGCLKAKCAPNPLKAKTKFDRARASQSPGQRGTSSNAFSRLASADSLASIPVNAEKWALLPRVIAPLSDEAAKIKGRFGRPEQRATHLNLEHHFRQVSLLPVGDDTADLESFFAGLGAQRNEFMRVSSV